MPTAWRLVKEKQAADAFSGEGATKHAGRWNPRGVRLIYASSTISLAALEILVHLVPPINFAFLLFRIEFDDDLVEKLSRRSLPRDWKSEPPGPSTQAIGEKWVRKARSAVLEVPSAIVPKESNYLLNPSHPDFRRIKIRKPERFAFDSRLL